MIRWSGFIEKMIENCCSVPLIDYSDVKGMDPIWEIVEEMIHW